MRRAFGAWAWPLLVVGLLGPAAAAPVEVPVIYVTREGTEPSRASLLEPAQAAYGLRGAQFGIAEINQSGQFLGRHYQLTEVTLRERDDLKSGLRSELAGGHRLIIADLQASDLLALADLPEARDALILDARTSDDRLRQADCRSNVFHLLPNEAMRTDALGQYLAHRDWKRWFVMRGKALADATYLVALQRSAARYGASIVEQKTFTPGANEDDEAAARQQVQAQIPTLTHVKTPYDVLIVADSNNSFGDYLLFNTWESRLVAGTHGLVAEAWDRQFRDFSARGVLLRFYERTKREMTERDYGNSLAAALIGEAVARSGKTDAPSLKGFILTDQFSVPGNKGEGLTFRPWDHQLRQPVLLFGPRILVAMAPQPDPKDPDGQKDALGFGQRESACRLTR